MYSVAFLSAFKKKIGEAKKTAGAVEKSHEKKADPAEPRKSAKAASLEEKAAVSGVVLRPHITEKSATLAGEHVYTFRVSLRATKRLVKEAVERLYGVEASGVRMIVIPAKTRTRGRYRGKKSGYRKALVRLKEGYSIAEFMQH